MSWKEKIARVLFYLCIIPFAALIIGCVGAYISGIEMGHYYLTGMSAVQFYCLEVAECIFLPVMCFIYQAAYVFVTRNKKNPNPKNMVFLSILSVIAIFIGIGVTYATNSIYDDFVENVYVEKPYGETLIVMLPYEEKYADTVDTTIRIRYEEVFAYVDTHYGEKALVPMLERFWDDYTSYMISVSPVLDGEPILTESDIRLQFSEGKKDIRMVADYRVKRTDENYIIVCISNAAVNDTYTVSSVWK